MLSGRETCHKEPIEFSVYSVDQLLTSHEGTKYSRGKKIVSRLCARGFVSPYPDEGESRKENEDFVRQEWGNEQKTESRPISVWSPELRDGLGKPTEVAGLLPWSQAKRTGGKTNRIRKEFLPPGKI